LVLWWYYYAVTVWERRISGIAWQRRFALIVLLFKTGRCVCRGVTAPIFILL